MKKQITKFSPLIITLSIESGRFSATAQSGTNFECLHKEILAVAPKLKPFVDLHLSDLDGVPMHSEENGWYWLAKAAGIPQKYEPKQSLAECFVLFCSHARMTSLEALELREKVQKAKNPRAIWQKQIDGLRPRWKSEADAALKLLETF